MAPLGKLSIALRVAVFLIATGTGTLLFMGFMSAYYPKNITASAAGILWLVICADMFRRSLDTRFERLWNWTVTTYHSVFNVWFALISAFINGSLDAFHNWGHGDKAHLYAGASQAALSFFSTGVTARVIQHFSPMKYAMLSYLIGPLSAGALTFAFCYIVHSLNGTPAFWPSVLTPTLISYTTGFGTNFLTRMGYMRPRNYPKQN